MCGIAGIVNFSSTSVPDRAEIESMCSIMKLRGPDNQGIWLKDKIALGHRRLSIVDLSIDGNQPMHDIDQTVSIVFNGEIYNFLILKRELEDLGCIFKTRSDTEVLIIGYKVWGIGKLLNKIDGMFSFVIVDHAIKRSFLCRDRFGKKPLYYHRSNDKFVFASDIKSVVMFLANKEIDYESLDYYLTELSVPQPKTIFKNVYQVYKSSYLVLDNDSGTIIDQKKYWELPNSIVQAYDENEVLTELETKLTNAILKRTISDVPLGCFLSGGADSGLIVALLAQHTTERVKTFTVGFAEEDFSELPLAKALAKKYNTEHTEIVIQPSIKDEIESLVDYYGEPFADSSSIPTYLICREMRKHVTVALSGDGGDELFGYNNYTYALMLDDFLRSHKTPLSRKIKVVSSKLKSRINQSQNFGAVANSLKNEADGHLLNRGMAFMPNEKEYLYNKNNHSMRAGFAMNELGKIWNSYTGTFGQKIFLASTDTRLLNDYLVKVDRSSMKSSLEVRSPFLDKDLSEFAFSLPPELKLKGNTAKYLLKKLAEKHIDPDFFNRKKQGFGMPVRHWIKNELKSLVNEVLSEEKIKKQGFFDYVYVKKIITENESGKSNNTHKIWALLWFGIWYEKEFGS